MQNREDANNQKSDTAHRVFSPLLEMAVELAAEWHDQTYRKSRWREIAIPPPLEEELAIPVMAHVTTVAIILQRSGWEDEVIAAGLLHDVIEDENRFGQALRYEDLRRRMGDGVAELVLQVSEPKFDEHGKRRSWQERKEIYIENLRNAIPEAAGISLADKLHNLWTMNQSLEKGINIFTAGRGRHPISADPERQNWFFTEVLAASRLHADDRLVPMREELAREISRFAEHVRP